MNNLSAVDYDFHEGILRINQLEELAVPQSSAYPMFWYSQDVFPYWINRVGPGDFEVSGTRNSLDIYKVIARLVIGHLTEGYDGELEETLWSHIPRVLQTFRERPFLQSPKYSSAQKGLESVGVTLSQGYDIFRDTPDLHIGCEFTIDLTYSTTFTERF